jgi:membrane-bound lytic murein transglycosylase D
MRPVPLLLLILSCALAADAAAQGTPSTRRPAADSIRMAEEGNVVSIDEIGEEEADTVPVPQDGPYARAGGTGPFTVQASGEPAPRPARGEVVWVNTAPARPAAGDSARAASGQRVASGQTTRRDTASTTRPASRDTARTGSGQRVTSGQTTRRDTASTTRPASRDTARTGSGQRVTSGQAPRRDTASAARPTSRDTARAGTGQRVTSGQTTRRDTASATRPTSRDTARTGSGQRVTSGQATRRDTASASRPGPRDTVRIGGGQRVTSGQTTRRDTARTRPTGTTTTPATGRTNTAGSRARSHTVAAGETFYGIARRYGVTAAQLRALNPDVDMDALEVGDVLRLPAGARDSRPSTQPPSAGTQPQGRTGTAAPTPPRGSRTHTVAAGETLFGIARRYGVTVAAIRQANGMEEDQDQVRTGQRLVIPPAR